MSFLSAGKKDQGARIGGWGLANENENLKWWKRFSHYNCTDHDDYVMVMIIWYILTILMMKLAEREREKDKIEIYSNLKNTEHQYIIDALANPHTLIIIQ